MTTTLERVRAAVIKAVPEIVEVRYGCEIRRIADEEDEQTILHVCGYHPFYFQAKTDTTEGEYLDYTKSEWEIIGREITFADVLRTMPWGVHLTTTGDDIRMVAYDREGSCLGLEYWKLPLPLHLQSEEVLTFLDKTLNHD